MMYNSEKDHVPQQIVEIHSNKAPMSVLLVMETEDTMNAECITEIKDSKEDAHKIYICTGKCSISLNNLPSVCHYHYNKNNLAANLLFKSDVLLSSNNINSAIKSLLEVIKFLDRSSLNYHMDLSNRLRRELSNVINMHNSINEHRKRKLHHALKKEIDQQLIKEVKNVCDCKGERSQLFLQKTLNSEGYHSSSPTPNSNGNWANVSVDSCMKSLDSFSNRKCNNLFQSTDISEFSYDANKVFPFSKIRLNSCGLNSSFENSSNGSQSGSSYKKSKDLKANDANFLPSNERSSDCLDQMEALNIDCSSETENKIITGTYRQKVLESNCGKGKTETFLVSTPKASKSNLKKFAESCNLMVMQNSQNKDSKYCDSDGVFGLNKSYAKNNSMLAYEKVLNWTAACNTNYNLSSCKMGFRQVSNEISNNCITTAINTALNQSLLNRPMHNMDSPLITTSVTHIGPSQMTSDSFYSKGISIKNSKTSSIKDSYLVDCDMTPALKSTISSLVASQNPINPFESKDTSILTSVTSSVAKDTNSSDVEVTNIQTTQIMSASQSTSKTDITDIANLNSSAKSASIGSYPFGLEMTPILASSISSKIISQSKSDSFGSKDSSSFGLKATFGFNDFNLSDMELTPTKATDEILPKVISQRKNETFGSKDSSTLSWKTTFGFNDVHSSDMELTPKNPKSTMTSSLCTKETFEAFCAEYSSFRSQDAFSNACTNLVTDTLGKDSFPNINDYNSLKPVSSPSVATFKSNDLPMPDNIDTSTKISSKFHKDVQELPFLSNKIPRQKKRKFLRNVTHSPKSYLVTSAGGSRGGHNNPSYCGNAPPKKVRKIEVSIPIKLLNSPYVVLNRLEDCIETKPVDVRNICKKVRSKNCKSSSKSAYENILAKNFKSSTINTCTKVLAKKEKSSIITVMEIKPKPNQRMRNNKNYKNTKNKQVKIRPNQKILKKRQAKQLVINNNCTILKKIQGRYNKSKKTIGNIDSSNTKKSFPQNSSGFRKLPNTLKDNSKNHKQKKICSNLSKPLLNDIKKDCLKKIFSNSNISVSPIHSEKENISSSTVENLCCGSDLNEARFNLDKDKKTHYFSPAKGELCEIDKLSPSCNLSNALPEKCKTKCKSNLQENLVDIDLEKLSPCDESVTEADIVDNSLSKNIFSSLEAPTLENIMSNDHLIENITDVSKTSSISNHNIKIYEAKMNVKHDKNGLDVCKVSFPSSFEGFSADYKRSQNLILPIINQNKYSKDIEKCTAETFINNMNLPARNEPLDQQQNIEINSIGPAKDLHKRKVNDNAAIKTTMITETILNGKYLTSVNDVDLHDKRLPLVEPFINIQKELINTKKPTEYIQNSIDNLFVTNVDLPAINLSESEPLGMQKNIVTGIVTNVDTKDISKNNGGTLGNEDVLPVISFPSIEPFSILQNLSKNTNEHSEVIQKSIDNTLVAKADLPVINFPTSEKLNDMKQNFAISTNVHVKNIQKNKPIIAIGHAKDIQKNNDKTAVNEDALSVISCPSLEEFNIQPNISININEHRTVDGQKSKSNTSIYKADQPAINLTASKQFSVKQDAAVNANGCKIDLLNRKDKTLVNDDSLSIRSFPDEHNDIKNCKYRTSVSKVELPAINLTAGKQFSVKQDAAVNANGCKINLQDRKNKTLVNDDSLSIRSFPDEHNCIKNCKDRTSVSKVELPAINLTASKQFSVKQDAAVNANGCKIDLQNRKDKTLVNDDSLSIRSFPDEHNGIKNGKDRTSVSKVELPAINLTASKQFSVKQDAAVNANSCKIDLQNRKDKTLVNDESLSIRSFPDEHNGIKNGKDRISVSKVELPAINLTASKQFSVKQDAAVNANGCKIDLQNRKDKTLVNDDSLSIRIFPDEHNGIKNCKDKTSISKVVQPAINSSVNKQFSIQQISPADANNYTNELAKSEANSIFAFEKEKTLHKICTISSNQNKKRNVLINLGHQKNLNGEPDGVSTLRANIKLHDHHQCDFNSERGAVEFGLDRSFQSRNESEDDIISLYADGDFQDLDSEYEEHTLLNRSCENRCPLKNRKTEICERKKQILHEKLNTLLRVNEGQSSITNPKIQENKSSNQVTRQIKLEKPIMDENNNTNKNIKNCGKINSAITDDLLNECGLSSDQHSLSIKDNDLTLMMKANVFAQPKDISSVQQPIIKKYDIKSKGGTLNQIKGSKSKNIISLKSNCSTLEKKKTLTNETKLLLNDICHSTKLKSTTSNNKYEKPMKFPDKDFRDPDKDLKLGIVESHHSFNKPSVESGFCSEYFEEANCSKRKCNLSHKMNLTSLTKFLSDFVVYSVSNGNTSKALSVLEFHVKNKNVIDCDLTIGTLKSLSRAVIEGNIMIKILPKPFTIYFEAAKIETLCEMGKGNEAFQLLISSLNSQIDKFAKNYMFISFIRFCEIHSDTQFASPYEKAKLWNYTKNLLPKEAVNMQNTLDSFWLLYHIQNNNYEMVKKGYFHLCAKLSQPSKFFSDITLSYVNFLQKTDKHSEVFEVLDWMKKLRDNDSTIFTAISKSLEIFSDKTYTYKFYEAMTQLKVIFRSKTVCQSLIEIAMQHDISLAVTVIEYFSEHMYEPSAKQLTMIIPLLIKKDKPFEWNLLKKLIFCLSFNSLKGISMLLQQFILSIPPQYDAQLLINHCKLKGVDLISNNAAWTPLNSYNQNIVTPYPSLNNVNDIEPRTSPFIPSFEMQDMEKQNVNNQMRMRDLVHQRKIPSDSSMLSNPIQNNISGSSSNNSTNINMLPSKYCIKNDVFAQNSQEFKFEGEKNVTKILKSDISNVEEYLNKNMASDEEVIEEIIIEETESVSSPSNNELLNDEAFQTYNNEILQDDGTPLEECKQMALVQNMVESFKAVVILGGLDSQKRKLHQIYCLFEENVSLLKNADTILESFLNCYEAGSSTYYNENEKMLIGHFGSSLVFCCYGRYLMTQAAKIVLILLSKYLKFYLYKPLQQTFLPAESQRVAIMSIDALSKDNHFKEITQIIGDMNISNSVEEMGDKLLILMNVNKVLLAHKRRCGVEYFEYFLTIAFNIIETIHSDDYYRRSIDTFFLINGSWDWGLSFQNEILTNRTLAFIHFCLDSDISLPLRVKDHPLVLKLAENNTHQQKDIAYYPQQLNKNGFGPRNRVRPNFIRSGPQNHRSFNRGIASTRRPYNVRGRGFTKYDA